MSQLIQLLPGLKIHFAADGCWLHFEGKQHQAGFHLANILGDHPVVGRSILEWIQRMHDAGIWYDQPGNLPKEDSHD